MVIELEDKVPQMVEVCRRNGASKVWLFGSATGSGVRSFRAQSDVDLLIEFDARLIQSAGFNHPLYTLPEALSEIAQRPVRITENIPFRNPFFQDDVDRTRELIYDREAEEAALGH